jgi:hypothetical protein
VTPANPAIRAPPVYVKTAGVWRHPGPFRVAAENAAAYKDLNRAGRIPGTIG